jgi:hypothetical protein
VFAAVAAWARCHAKLTRLADKTSAPVSPAAGGSPHACHHSPQSSDSSSSNRASCDSGSTNGSSGELADTLPDPALDQ